MELLNQLEIVDVIYEENLKKVTFQLLHEERGELREVHYNKQSFDKNQAKFVDDPEKAVKVDEWSKEYFDLPFLELGQAIGRRMDVYCYDNFNSFWEVQQLSKFDDDMVGQLFEVTVTKAEDDGKKLSIQFDYDGNSYESKMSYADYLESRKEWFINPLKKKKQFEKFKDKFQIPADRIGELVGKDVMVEVKKAMGKFVYVEVKPFPKKVVKK
jgi:hypothetical protein